MQSGVSYSAYGTGDKPKLYASPENGADPDKWSLVNGTDNIWVYEKEMYDVGLVVFNDGESWSSKEIPSYIPGTGFVIRGTESDPQLFSLEELDENLEHVSLCDSVCDSNGYPIREEAIGKLYLRCNEGNPGEVYDSIEFSLSVYIVDGRSVNGVSKSNVLIDNLCVKNGGAHGIGVGDVTGFTVQNCEVGFIGGGIQSYSSSTYKATRYGNGIEVHGSCDGFIVKNNYVYQCYDAGISHQRSADTVNVDYAFNNIAYSGNLVENCTYSIEYFMGESKLETPRKRIMSNILFENNILRTAGEGFGIQRLNNDKYGYRFAHIMSWWSVANSAENFVIRNNTLDRSEYALMLICAADEESLPRMSGNVYIQSSDKDLGIYGLTREADEPRIAFDTQVESYVKDNIDPFAMVEAINQ